jgi:hypothetical protein
MECEPRDRVAIGRVAMPFAPTPPVPSEFTPSKKVTVPVMVPAVVEVTVAVRVTEAPTLDGFSDEVSVVDVAAVVEGFTVWVSAVVVLPEKLESPA